MCGINGLINFNYTKSQGKNILNKMQQAITRQTTPSGKIYQFRQVFLGHNALKYNYHGQTYTIVYQGHLDNTTILARKLNNRRIQLKSNHDAELIVKLFAIDGVKIFRKLSGNFAFAIYENTTNRLWLVRDPLGIKPLFYTQQKGGLVFGSKIKSLLAHPNVLPIVDLDGLRELFGVCPARTPGKTVYKNIYEIKPGAYGCWEKGKFTTKNYFQLTSRPHRDNSTVTMRKIKTMLQNSLQQQTPTDKRVGYMLSGGLDSSAITALASHDGQTLRTFSVDYDGNQANFKPTDFSPTRDNYYIDLVSKQYHVQHRYHLLSSSDLCDMLYEALVARDYPAMADIDSSLLLFCRALKQDIDVCFSGEFADEIFCGYPWFYRADTHQATTFPWAINLAIRENTIAKPLRSVLNIKDFVARTFANAVAEVPLSATDSPADRQMKTYSYLTMRWFGLNLLERGERMASHYGLEIQMPFTNLDLVKYAYNIPWTLKNYGEQEKGILRNALASILPPEIIARKKCPYPKTVDPIYTALIEQRIRALITDEEHPVWQIVDIDYIRQVLNDTSPHNARPWFGQLMQRPQYLAFIYQIALWLTEYQIKLELGNE